ncbi:hypothetical protein CISG_08471 [Coccidioides immitis RMSCC 3703]|uniref:Uncharacterized protein n=2 Tax=Coccidioides immitis TaxID=5501 RepID=A0A0J8R6U4_COCIT|nr:hypothetical protein CIRG_06226 [Coccidioides immitis RMSCC 2394]KMU80561.1 hypothetical protein CISG_08471 [Coccidioides immitis RMSCC 3703]
MEDIHTLCCQRFMQTPATVDSSGASTAKRAFVASPNHRPCLDHFPYLISISSHLFPRAKNAKKDLEGKASLEVCGIRAEQGWTYKDLVSAPGRAQQTRILFSGRPSR